LRKKRLHNPSTACRISQPPAISNDASIRQGLQREKLMKTSDGVQGDAGHRLKMRTTVTLDDELLAMAQQLHGDLERNE
jgi:hypothetical protein